MLKDFLSDKNIANEGVTTDVVAISKKFKDKLKDLSKTIKEAKASGDTSKLKEAITEHKKICQDYKAEVQTVEESNVKKTLGVVLGLSASPFFIGRLINVKNAKKYSLHEMTKMDAATSNITKVSLINHLNKLIKLDDEMLGNLSEMKEGVHESLIEGIDIAEEFALEAILEKDSISLDLDIVTEGFKGRLDSIADKIKTFLEKIVGWIKEKYMKLLNKDLSVDPNLWKGIDAVFMLCDKAQARLMSGAPKLLTAPSASSTPEIDHEEIKAITGSVMDSEAYKKVQEFSSDSKAEKITVKGMELSAQKNKFHQILDTLQKMSNMMKNESDNSQDKERVKFLGNQMAYIKEMMNIVNLRISMINKLISHSTTI